MLRVTLFTAPKPCVGDFATIQSIALRSWAEIGPGVSIIVFGDEEGVAALADSVGARHYPEVRRTKQGTPLVNDLFAKAEDISSSDLLCYANADIIFLDDFMPTLRLAAERVPRAMIVGRRHDIDLTEFLDFSAGWQDRLRVRVVQKARLRGPDAIDYFAYPRRALGEIPPFVIGRPKWDNWLLYHARRCGLALIDATRAITAVHQNHDYSHHQSGWEGVRRGPEAETNQSLSGGPLFWFTVEDSTHRINHSEVLRWHHPGFRRRLLQFAALTPRGRLAALSAVRLLDLTFPIRRRLGLTSLNTN